MKRTYPTETLDHIRQALTIEEVRYKELKRKGTRALSYYDIEIAAGGDAQAALRTALMLTCNHITYYQRQLRERTEQLNLFAS